MEEVEWWTSRSARIAIQRGRGLRGDPPFTGVLYACRGNTRRGVRGVPGAAVSVAVGRAVSGVVVSRAPGVAVSVAVGRAVGPVSRPVGRAVGSVPGAVRPAQAAQKSEPPRRGNITSCIAIASVSRPVSTSVSRAVSGAVRRLEPKLQQIIYNAIDVDMIYYI